MTGRRQAAAITGKVNPMIPTFAEPTQASGPRTPPENKNHRMTTVDGVPCPAYVGGVKVVSARYAEAPEGQKASPIYAGRTLLVLDDGTKRNGCSDCWFTHTHWSAVAGHRTEEHGAPKAIRQRRAPATGQLELTSAGIAATADGDGEPDDDGFDNADADDGDPGQDLVRVVHTGEVVDDQPVSATPSRGRGRIPPAAAGGVLSMTLSEVLDLASDFYHHGADRENQAEEIARLRQENAELRRALRKVDTLLGRAHDVTAVTKSKKPKES